jgi:NADPH:quinone reductase-like Zn-dependent oxidoreductase
MHPSSSHRYKAVTLKEAGKYHDIILRNLELRPLRSDEVLVKLTAAAFNRRDVGLAPRT